MELLVAAVLIVGGSFHACARDYGQYSDRPKHLRDWFKQLQNKKTGAHCCGEADCARTEARIRDGRWEAKAPNGSWLAVPHESVVADKGNPIGEPILCSYNNWYDDSGWLVYCFVPGPGS